MSFGDVTDGTRIILEGNKPVKITLGGTVAVGDPIAVSGGSGVQADADNSLYAELVAGETGDSGEIIVCYSSARIGGITTGTVGARLYLSNTAGGYSVTAGAVTQDIGFEIGNGEMWVEPEWHAALLMASGGVISFAGSDVTITHSTGKLLVETTWASGGTTGRPFGVNLTVDAALGSFSNAIKGYVAYGSSGRTDGLGSAVNAEILLSTGTTQGTYAPLESELVANSAVSTGTSTSFWYSNIAGSDGTGKTTLNANGYLFELGVGVVDTSNGLFDVVTKTPTSVEFDANLKIKIGGTDYFIPLSTDNAFE